VPGFPQGVIIVMPLPTHARGHTVLLEAVLVRRSSLWAAAIGVRPHAGWRPVMGERAGSGVNDGFKIPNKDNSIFPQTVVECPP
jgi:hypothetical protein